MRITRTHERSISRPQRVLPGHPGKPDSLRCRARIRSEHLKSHREGRRCARPRHGPSDHQHVTKGKMAGARDRGLGARQNPRGTAGARNHVAARFERGRSPSNQAASRRSPSRPTRGASLVRSNGRHSPGDSNFTILSTAISFCSGRASTGTLRVSPYCVSVTNLLQARHAPLCVDHREESSPLPTKGSKTSVSRGAARPQHEGITPFACRITDTLARRREP